VLKFVKCRPQNDRLSDDILDALVGDATTSQLCCDLYEALMKRDLVRKKDEWIGRWIKPLFARRDVVGASEELNRLRRSAMLLDESVIDYTTSRAKLSGVGDQTVSESEQEDRLRIGLLGLRYGIEYVNIRILLDCFATYLGLPSRGNSTARSTWSKAALRCPFGHIRTRSACRLWSASS
jgi:hypothetical protein